MRQLEIVFYQNVVIFTHWFNPPMSQENSRPRFRTTLWNALLLDGHFYENARNTPKNHQIARTIVALAALSHMLGSGVILLINLAKPTGLIIALIIDGLSVVLGYYFWTFTIDKIGQWMKPNHVSFGELLVQIGFAYAPQSLNFLTLIPLLGRPIEIALSVWSLLAVIVAVRQGLDVSNRKATLICLIGWPIIQLAIGFVQVLQQDLIKYF
jgi:TM2 domain-containing membrane protein YozV